jgi:hypothetical protein
LQWVKQSLCQTFYSADFENITSAKANKNSPKSYILELYKTGSYIMVANGSKAHKFGVTNV